MTMNDHGSIYFQSFQSEGMVILKCIVYICFIDIIIINVSESMNDVCVCVGGACRP